MSKKLYFLIPNRVYITDAIRSTLGQAIENHYSHACVLYNKMPKVSEYVKENIEWIRDMEGDVFAVVDTMDEEAKKYNVDEVGLTPITLEELAQRLKEADLIIPYGLPRSLHAPPPACAD
ncbi:hypothetical protein G4V39_09315 [Thermosulfuriphilus ammonigenes]|uniref:Uncharacterized protein n=1 Tax=Thermosulfuriphilus ammonigenes TaxID=1936021 RepID=A0A6G7PY30_9BACT|nr:hypothetical protein [Thermosulfuriphilus ammonigenes]MBA2849383.1 nucleoside-triphosphatase THEP1 [Thermosulfuriphilus ammonigenes]QIJ72456.1 hypothetical protein G4V39_09315 [Thermosulfuriphilus ammonigenes]